MAAQLRLATEISSGFGAAELLIIALIAIVGLALVAFLVAALVRRSRSTDREGDNQDEALQSHRPTEERLAEIDRLQANGTISAAERDAARARALDSH